MLETQHPARHRYFPFDMCVLENVYKGAVYSLMGFHVDPSHFAIFILTARDQIIQGKEKGAVRVSNIRSYWSLHCPAGDLLFGTKLGRLKYTKSNSPRSYPSFQSKRDNPVSWSKHYGQICPGSFCCYHNLLLRSHRSSLRETCSCTVHGLH